jgi:hypothetical protein
MERKEEEGKIMHDELGELGEEQSEGPEPLGV